LIEDFTQIDRLIKRLGKKSPVRRVAEDLLAGRAASYDAASVLQATLAEPAGHRWKEQVVAIWAFTRMPLEENERAAIISDLEWQLAQRPARSIGCILASAYLCSCVGWVWMLYTADQDSAANRVRQAAATAVGLMGTPSSAEALGRALVEPSSSTASGDKSVRIAATVALTRILSREPDAAFGLLPSGTTRSLCRLLRNPKDDTVWWAIKALALVGGSSAIPYVERTARAHRSPHVRQEALTTLEALNERQRREQEHNTLLRATTQPAEPNEVLLRPATGTGEAGAETLLRTTTDGQPDVQSQRTGDAQG
jgi:hypothetical protein